MSINVEVHHILNTQCPPVMHGINCQRNQDTSLMSPLSYAHLAALPDKISMHSPPTASNKKDILTQSQMLG
jgi:hypothetical protein